MPQRLLLVEDHPIYADAVASVVRRAFPRMLPTVALTLATAVAAAERVDPTVVLLDLWLPDTHGLEGLLALRRVVPRAAIIPISAFDEEPIVERTLMLGASGFISKTWTAAQIVEALSAVMNGAVAVPWGPSRALMRIERSRSSMDHNECGELGEGGMGGDRTPVTTALERVLTLQQVRVLEKLCEGKLNKQIAHELDIGETTVKAHVGEILRKLDVGSRTQAVVGVASLDFAARMLGFARIGERVAALRTRTIEAAKGDEPGIYP
ncbi:MAG: LuxR C-terminal-related transcriptional regulator [Hyphomicrobiaceae bacterium]